MVVVKDFASTEIANRRLSVGLQTLRRGPSLTSGCDFVATLMTPKKN